MKAKDPIDQMFQNLNSEFELESPASGHKQRFLEKLQNQKGSKNTTAFPKPKNWQWFLGIAASFALILSVSFGLNRNERPNDLASISPEMAETQTFFTSAIANELEKLNNEKLPEVQFLISDAKVRLNSLELAYDALKTDLNESGDDKLVIYAMIKNFQNRIEVLQNTLIQIDKIKALQNQEYSDDVQIL